MGPTLATSWWRTSAKLSHLNPCQHPLLQDYVSGKGRWRSALRGQALGKWPCPARATSALTPSTQKPEKERNSANRGDSRPQRAVHPAEVKRTQGRGIKQDGRFFKLARHFLVVTLRRIGAGLQRQGVSCVCCSFLSADSSVGFFVTLRLLPLLPISVWHYLLLLQSSARFRCESCFRTLGAFCS